MSDRPPLAVNPLRIAAMSLLLAAIAGCIAAGVRLLPDTATGTFVAFAAGMVLTPLLASPFEWVVHRYVYHRPVLRLLKRIYAVHVAHHHLYFPTSRYVTGGPPRRIPVFGGDVSDVATSTTENALTRAAHFSFYMGLGIVLICTPAWLATGNSIFLLGTFCSLIVVSDLFITVHDAIHRPDSHRLLQRQPWFRFLDEHHYIHHVDEQANTNFLLPLADWLFGTLRRSLTEGELAAHGPREAAKREVMGCGEPLVRGSGVPRAAEAPQGIT